MRGSNPNSHTLCGAGSYAALKKRVRGALWSWQEDRVIDRFVDDLVGGRALYAQCILPEVQRELDAVHAEHPDEPWAKLQRPLSGILGRLRKCAGERNAHWSNTEWDPLEQEVALRHARAFLSGVHPDMVVASRACCVELEQLALPASGRRAVESNRTGHAVYGYLNELARGMGFARADARWTEQENAIVRRYAREVVEGRLESAAEAGRAFMREHRRLRSGPNPPDWLARRRGRASVLERIRAEIRAQGGSLALAPWTAEEDALLDDFARQVVAGGYPDVKAAARECCRVRQERGMKPERGFFAVNARMQLRTREFGREPAARRLTPAESARLDTYLDALRAGRYRKLNDALRDFVRDYGESVGISHDTAQSRAIKVMGKKGERSPFIWSPAECAARDRRVDWYLERRTGTRTAGFNEAAEGLRRDLAALGRDRTLNSCQHQVYRAAMRRLKQAGQGQRK